MTFSEFCEEFLKGEEDIADVSMFGIIPKEISGQDVYKYTLLFRSEEIAIEYCCREFGSDKEKVLKELHADDDLREVYGREEYLRSAEVKRTFYIQELICGAYLLWDAY